MNQVIIERVFNKIDNMSDDELFAALDGLEDMVISDFIYYYKELFDVNNNSLISNNNSQDD